jgi:hypothetical protein
MSPQEWALEYVTRGWPVLPLYSMDDGVCVCSPRQKREKKCAPGKHPYVNLLHGVRDATLDAERVRMWWGERMWAKANIGIDLAGAGLLDVAPDNVADLAEFIARGLPETLTFRSGSGEGHQHFLYRLPEGAPRARLCLSGRYDLMSDGYAVVPPSSTVGPYEWLKYSPEMLPAEPPAWALELLALQVEGRTPATEVSVPGDAVIGEAGEPPLDIDRRVWAGVGAADRSGGLWAIAGELAQAGANEATIVEALRERDESLGWQKFSQRSDRERRYTETARRQLASVMPRIHLNGSAPPTTPTEYIAPPAAAWPAPLDEAAFYGVLGEVVRGIDPRSEADPAALLAHAIIVASAYVGPGVYAEAGDARHPPRFFAAIVGDTSKGRKGTAASPFRKAMLECDDPVRIASGLSSAEGLVFQVRDRVEKWNAKEQRYDTSDPGVADKRLVIIEGEYATLLRRMEREGNAVSQMLRDVWDHGNLETLVKLNPTKASGAHINIVVHITSEELAEYLHPTEVSSGSANRMLWFAAKRSKLLPRGGNAQVSVLASFAAKVDRARAWVTDQLEEGRIEFSLAAGSRWDDAYAALSEGVPGLFGQATQRAEAQVLRLAVLYAVLDCSSLIELAHLEAAFAVWRYCSDSARWIFGLRTGNTHADTIIAALRGNQELTRTQISDLFHRNVASDKISMALQVLLHYRLATFEQRSGGTGRPTEVWRAR